MIAECWRALPYKWSQNERSPFGLAVPGVSGLAPTTVPERLSESHGLRCLIAATKVAAINLVG